MKSRNIVVMIQIKTEKDIILLQDKDFWDNVLNCSVDCEDMSIMQAPAVFVVKDNEKPRKKKEN